MNSDLTLVPLEKDYFLMGFITNEKRYKINSADALGVTLDDLIK